MPQSGLESKPMIYRCIESNRDSRRLKSERLNHCAPPMPLIVHDTTQRHALSIFFQSFILRSQGESALQTSVTEGLIDP